jgi:hypothetical protein
MKTFAYGGKLPNRENRFHWGRGGRGVLGSEILALTGEEDSPLLNDLLPGDEDKELLWQVTRKPSAGNFKPYETGALSFTDAPDGYYEFDYRLLVNAVLRGSTTSDITVGEGAPPVTGVASWTEAAETISIAGQIKGTAVGRPHRRRRFHVRRGDLLHFFDTLSEAQDFLEAIREEEGPEPKKSTKPRKWALIKPEPVATYSVSALMKQVPDNKEAQKRARTMIKEDRIGPLIKWLEQQAAPEDDDIELLLMAL